MTEYITDVFVEVWRCPVVTTLIVIQSLVWAITYKSNLLNSGYIKNYAFTHESAFEKGQLWRIFSGPWMHVSVYHLLFNIACLWSLRFVEYSSSDFSSHKPDLLVLGQGSWFVLRYSLVMLLVSGILTMGMVHIMLWRFQVLARTVNAAARRIATVFATLPYFGFTAVVLGWCMFISMAADDAVAADSNLKLSYRIFGVLPMNFTWLPIVLFVIASLVVPRLVHRSGGPDFGEAGSAVSILHSCGLLTGILLRTNVIDVCPTVYWSLCMSVNAIAVCVISYWRNLQQGDETPSRAWTQSGDDSGDRNSVQAETELGAAGPVPDYHSTDQGTEAVPGLSAVGPIRRVSRVLLETDGQFEFLYLPAVQQHSPQSQAQVSVDSHHSSSSSDELERGVEMGTLSRNGVGRSWLPSLPAARQWTSGGARYTTSDTEQPEEQRRLISPNGSPRAPNSTNSLIPGGGALEMLDEDEDMEEDVEMGRQQQSERKHLLPR